MYVLILLCVNDLNNTFSLIIIFWYCHIRNIVTQYNISIFPILHVFVVIIFSYFSSYSIVGHITHCNLLIFFVTVCLNFLSLFLIRGYLNFTALLLTFICIDLFHIFYLKFYCNNVLFVLRLDCLPENFFSVYFIILHLNYLLLSTFINLDQFFVSYPGILRNNNLCLINVWLIRYFCGRCDSFALRLGCLAYCGPKLLFGNK